MTRCRALAITACVLAAHAVLMPRVVQWNMGERIREQAELRVGADATQRFCVGEGEEERLIAPEVTYRATTPIITFGSDENDIRAHDLRPTGHLRVITLPPLIKPRYALPPRARTTVYERWTGNPQQERREPRQLRYPIDTENTRWLGCAERQQEDNHARASALAAPFDYFLDPLLSTLCCPLAIWGAEVALLFCFLGYLWYCF